MRALLAWIAAAVVAVGCSSSTFSSSTNADGGGATGGASGSAGASGSGGTSGSAGASGSGGTSGSAGASGSGGVGGSGAAAGASGSAGAAATDGGATDASGPSTCPPGMPSGPCSGTAYCTYGDDARPECRSAAQCNNGNWSETAAACPALAPCPSPPPIIGSSCQNQNAECSIASGTVRCRCSAQCPNGTCGEPQWECTGAPPPPCPADLPNAGQPCAAATGTCSYGGCNMAMKVDVTCHNGTWRWTPVVCN